MRPTPCLIHHWRHMAVSLVTVICASKYLQHKTPCDRAAERESDGDSPGNRECLGRRALVNSAGMDLEM